MRAAGAPSPRETNTGCGARNLVVSARPAGDNRVLMFEAPPEVARYIAVKGSIAINGVSLTVNALRDPAHVQLSLIEFTLVHTTLGGLTAGDRVHVEADVIGKYVQRLAAGSLAALATQDHL